MKTIQKNASFRFYLPENPHVPEILLRKFYNELVLNRKKLKEEEFIE